MSTQNCMSPENHWADSPLLYSGAPHVKWSVNGLILDGNTVSSLLIISGSVGTSTAFGASKGDESI